MPSFRLVWLCGMVFAWGLAASSAQQQTEVQRKRDFPRANRSFPPPKTNSEPVDLILGNPRAVSIDLVVHPKTDLELRLVWWQDSTGRAQPMTKELGVTKGGQALTTTLDSLTPDSAYTYRVDTKTIGRASFESGELHHFHTQRAAGSNFTFVVQGDSHPERNPKMNVPDLYERTLLSAAQFQPDLFICLGDDFSIDTLRDVTKESVEGVYRQQVPYLSLIGRSTPVFLVNGNHEQACLANYNGTPDCPSVWAQNARNTNFAQPTPDGFYTGNAETLEHIGLLRNYYAWSWGDALFVAIDPYWHSQGAVDNSLGKGPKTEGGGKRNRDLWNVTLGKTQYDWLSKTLSSSKAKYKFVFAHHVNGTGRGGIEQARLYEWGGQGKNGTDEFKSKRPGWAMPIHDLFVKTGVTVFFQGHGHIFCRQELDGVVYQSCPVPADRNNELLNGDAYSTGDKIVGAGLVVVKVSPAQVNVEFRRSYLPEAETDDHRHGETAYSYVLKSKVKNS